MIHLKKDAVLPASEAESLLSSNIPKAGPSSALNLCFEEGVRVLVWFLNSSFIQSPWKSRGKLLPTQVSFDLNHEA